MFLFQSKIAHLLHTMVGKSRSLSTHFSFFLCANPTSVLLLQRWLLSFHGEIDIVYVGKRKRLRNAALTSEAQNVRVPGRRGEETVVQECWPSPGSLSSVVTLPADVRRSAIARGQSCQCRPNGLMQFERTFQKLPVDTFA